MEEFMKNQLDIAIKLASYYHNGQRDKNNEIYILHPLRIMFQMDTYKEKIVAVLHDIIEDTECTIDILRENGFSEEIITALKAITRKEDEQYIQYIYRVEKNSIASNVKIKDLVDNLSRKGADVSLRYRYMQALSILCKEEMPTKKVVIADFDGMEVYVDLLWPEIECLCINYQEEIILQFRLDKEVFCYLDEYKYIEPVFMEWYSEHKKVIEYMIERGKYYRLPD